MLNLLSKGTRWRAALLLAITYALTVLSPAIANAFAPAPVEVSHHLGLRSAHNHDDGHHHAHDHAAQHAHGHHGDGDKSKPASVDLQCCGLACISALPAAFVDICLPAALVSVRLSFAPDEAAGRSPPERYRPPIL
jgi:hypothetical protein